ncbi:MAG TPA: hypothetical protein DHW82_06470 [Spirochaetia bacterium]|nr:hypothetical protein [Spirochaetia bacterium]
MARRLVSFLLLFLFFFACSKKEENKEKEFSDEIPDLIYGDDSSRTPFEDFEADIKYLIDKNELKTVFIRLQDAQKIYPLEKTRIAFLYGVAYLSQNDLIKAKEFFKQSENDLKPETMVYYGHIARKEGDFKKAEKFYQDAYTMVQKTDILSNLGDLYYEHKMTAQAKEVYLKTIKLNPEAYFDRYLLANIYFQEGNLAESEKLLKESLEINKRFKKAYVGLYAIYEKKKNKAESYYYQCRVFFLDQEYDKVVNLLKKDETLVLKDMRLLKFYLVSLIREGMNEKASKIVESALKKYPDEPDLKMYEGTILSVNSPEKAKVFFQELLKKHPENFNILVSYADLLTTEAESEEAVKIYEKALLLEPENTSYRSKLAEIYRKNNQMDKEFYHRGVLYLYQEQLDQAMESLVRVKNPDYPVWYHFYLGKLYSEKKNYEEALKNYEKSIQEDKTFFKSYLELAYIYIENGNKKKALKILSDYPGVNEEIKELKLFIEKKI